MKMMRHLITVLFLVICCGAIHAQQLKVVEFCADLSMTDAVQFPKEDFNGDRCGLIKLGLTLPKSDVEFEGDIVLSENKSGEWWIYMPQGSNWLTIKSKSSSYLPLRCDFSDYGIDGVVSNVTYVMNVEKPFVGLEPEVVTEQYLTFQIFPANAVLEVNGKLWKVEPDGSSTNFVSFGDYHYRVQAPNYHSEEDTVTVDDPANAKKVTVSLKPDFVSVTLQVDADAEIWVNNERKGIGMWTGQLGKTTYKVECKQVGHETSVTTQEITEAMNGKTILLPAPKPVFGSSNIESTPNYAKIYIDGKAMGETPKSISQLLIGQHELKLIKDGYEEYKENVTITKGERKQVKATLSKQKETPQSIATTNSSSENQTFTLNGVSFTMKYVEGGSFQMGDNLSDSRWEQPAHKVTVSSFYIGETEVTQALWKAVTGSNPSVFKGDNLPVENVSYNDIVNEFLPQLNKLTGKNFRLPREAEWEYAARGGKRSRGYQYSGSNSIDNIAWYWKNSGDNDLDGDDEDWNWNRIVDNGSGTKNVKGKLPNELGIYDMSGNVWEWCSDAWYEYNKNPENNPRHDGNSESRRVLRGGSWCSRKGDCRITFRSGRKPDDCYDKRGFRLCLPQ